ERRAHWPRSGRNWGSTRTRSAGSSRTWNCKVASPQRQGGGTPCIKPRRQTTMLDVALVSLIPDMSEKAGVDGTIQYWQRVGENLARRIGKEAYMGWPSFNGALRQGPTGFSIEGDEIGRAPV